MRLHTTALSLTAGVIWAAAIFLVALANMIWPTYGDAFLAMTASIYPGYEASSTIGSVIIGTVFGFIDGAVGGAVFGWLYNRLVIRLSNKTA